MHDQLSSSPDWADTNPVPLVIDAFSQQAPFNKLVLLSALAEVMANVKPGDTFILYVTGHGTTLTPANSTPDEGDESSMSAGDEVIKLSPDADESQWLQDDELVESILNTGSGDFLSADVAKAFILDTCRSGGFWGGQDAGDLERLSNAAILAASPEDRNSQWGQNLRGMDLTLGVFTCEVLDGLVMADGWGDVGPEGRDLDGHGDGSVVRVACC